MSTATLTPEQTRIRAYRLRNKRAEMRRQAGIPGYVPGAPVAAHLRSLLSMGWTQLEVAATSGVSPRAMRYILNGQRSIQRPNAEAIMRVRAADAPRVDATASVRRIQGLAYMGWPITWTAVAINRHPTALHHILGGQNSTFRRASAELLAEVYASHSSRRGPSEFSSAIARRNNWASPVTWDDDTIADPAAHPDWTGYCGSDRGYWTHRNQQLPMCAECKAAHEQWRSERAVLSPKDLGKQQLLARAAASNRGAEIAEDARELMRQGYDAEQAAARLGIGKHHLQQELIRHRDPAAAVAA